MAEVCGYRCDNDEPYFRYNLECRYAYNGKTYTATVYNFKTIKEAETLYPIGSKVYLFIDPKKPWQYSC